MRTESGINKLEGKVAELEAERDALAATVERWHSVYVDLTNSMMMFDGVAHYVADNAMMRRFDEIDESSPTTSLARLKAEWQAEALEDYADDMTIEQNQHTARARALKIRRRAV